jgi:hypothetical protein
MLHVFSAFEAEGLEYILIGATAMGFHGVIRATEDVDLLIRQPSQTSSASEGVSEHKAYHDPHIDEISPADLMGDYPVVRYYPPWGDLFFDVMTRLGEAANFDTVEAEIKEVEGIRVCVATLSALPAEERTRSRHRSL